MRLDIKWLLSHPSRVKGLHERSEECYDSYYGGNPSTWSLYQVRVVIHHQCVFSGKRRSTHMRHQRTFPLNRAREPIEVATPRHVIIIVKGWSSSRGSKLKLICDGWQRSNWKSIQAQGYPSFSEQVSNGSATNGIVFHSWPFGTAKLHHRRLPQVNVVRLKSRLIALLGRWMILCCLGWSAWSGFWESIAVCCGLWSQFVHLIDGHGSEQEKQLQSRHAQVNMVSVCLGFRRNHCFVVIPVLVLMFHVWTLKILPARFKGLQNICSKFCCRANYNLNSCHMDPETKLHCN